jgi:hypothetical protein
LLYGSTALRVHILTIWMIQKTQDISTRSKPLNKLNKPISLVRLENDQTIKFSDFAFFKQSGFVLWGRLINISKMTFFAFPQKKPCIKTSKKHRFSAYSTRLPPFGKNWKNSSNSPKFRQFSGFSPNLKTFRYTL